MKKIILFTLVFFGSILGHAEEAAPIDYSAYAPPTLPTELSEKIEKYLDIRAPGVGLLAPSGHELFFTWNVTGTSQVWRLESPKGFPIQMTGGDQQTSINDVSPDGKWLIISRDRGGEENPGLYRLKPSGGALQLISRKPKVQTLFEFISHDSKWVYFRANDLAADSYAIYRFSLLTGETETVFSEPGLWSILDHKDDGTLLLSKSLGNFANEVYEWSPKNKKLTPLFGQGEKLPYAVAYGAKPGEFFVNTFKMGEFFVLYSYQNGKYRQISKKQNWDVSSFTIDRKRQRILYVANENGFTRLYGLDAKSGLPLKLPSFPRAEHVQFGGFDLKGEKIMLSVSRPDEPRVSYSYDFKTAQLQQWVIPSHPEIDTATFASAEQEYYPARDGTQIPMLVRRPASCKGGVDSQKKVCPVIVVFHGGPESQVLPGFSPGDQLFLDEGFVLVEPNVRGSRGYGRTWLEADNGAKRLEVITDIDDIGKYIKVKWQVAGVSPKIGVMGGSYGGYATNVAMTLFAGTYDAGSAYVGMTNLITFIANTASYRRTNRMSEYGDPAVDREAMEKLSPIFNVDRISAPLQLIYGANDPRVPVSEGLQMLQKMKEKNIPGRMIVFPDEGHGAKKRENVALVLGHELLFFKKTLQIDSPQPAK